jgi:arylsulfatase
VLALYSDLGPQLDTTRFFVFYATLLIGIWALFGGLPAVLAGALERSQRAWTTALGFACGTFLMLLARYALSGWVTRHSLERAVTLPDFLVCVAGALVLGVAAHRLADSRLPVIPWAWAGGPICLLLAAFLFSTRPAPTEDRGPTRPGSGTRVTSPLPPGETSILLVTIDTLRADHLDAYGYPRPTAPRLTELGRRGIRVERAIAQQTLTSPSMATLLTGTYPHTHQLLHGGQSLQGFNLTLAEILASSGFHTRALLSTPGLTVRRNFQQGFHEFQRTLKDVEVLRDDRLESRHLNELVIGALQELQDTSAEPFFLWVHYRDPHTPYLVPEDYAALFTDDALSRRHGGRQLPVRDGATIGAMSRFLADVQGSRDFDFLVAQYDAEIRFNDDSLGQLLDAMDEKGLSERALVVVTADHGESLGEHDQFFQHGLSPYETIAHVPLVFFHPDLPSGRVVSETVSLVDLVPTLLDLVTLPTPSSVQGQSFAASLLGREEGGHRPYHFVISAFRHGYLTHAVTTATHKLVLRADARWRPIDAPLEAAALAWTVRERFSPYRCRRMDHEFYDLERDPREEHNLAGTEPELEERLAHALWEWLDAASEPRAAGGLAPQ